MIVVAEDRLEVATAADTVLQLNLGHRTMRRLLFVLLLLAIAGVIAFVLRRSPSASPATTNPVEPAAQALPASAPASVDAPTSELVSAKPADASDDTRSAQAPPVASAAKEPVLRCLVVDPKGVPVPRAQVCVNAFAANGGGFEGKLSPTDEHGRLAFESLPASVLHVQAFAPGFAPSILVDPRSAMNSHDELRLELRTAAHLTGEVLDGDGRPEIGRGVVVSVTNASNGRPTYAVADERGRFEISDLPPGRATIRRRQAPGEIDGVADPARRAVARAHLLEQATVTLREGESVHVVLGGNASRSVHLFGTVSNTAGLAGALYVNAWPQAPQLDRRQRARLVCPVGEQGRYDIQLDAPGPYVVSVDGLTGRLTALTVDVPAQPELELDLALGGASVRGVVRDAAGQPLANAELLLARAPAADVRRTGDARFRLATGADGSFRFEHLTPGRYGLSALDRSAGDRVSAGLARCDDFVLADGEQREIAIEFPPAASLEVEVVGPHGPLANALVRIWDDRERASPTDTSARTDAQGRVRCAALMPGPRWIDAQTDELVAPLSGPVQIVAGASALARVALAPGTFVDVTIAAGARESLDVVSLFDAQGRLAVSRITSSAASGKLRLGPLAPGEYTLVALAGTAVVLERALHVAEAGVLALTLELPQ